MKRLLLLLPLIAWTGSLHAQQVPPVQIARFSLEQARDGQTEVLKRLADLTAGRQQAASTTELLQRLATIHQMQLAVVRSTRAMLAQTFGQAIDSLSQADRQAIDRISVDQRTVQQRLSDWMATLNTIASADDAPDALRTVNARASVCPAGKLMDKVLGEISRNRLAEAATIGSNAADEIARLLQMLEGAISTAKDLSERHLRELREIIRLQRQVRSKLAEDEIPAMTWLRLRREQADIRERTRLLTFEESGLSPDAIRNVKTAHESMQLAESAMRRKQPPETIQAVDDAIRALEQAVEQVILAASQKEQDELPGMPDVDRKSPKKLGGMPAMAGVGGEGIDVSPIAQIAADIALVAKLRRLQEQLYAETLGKALAKPLPANRQRAYAAQLPQLIRRVELYLASSASLLGEARQAMAESMEHLEADDKRASASRQEIAIDRLRTAETQMRAFWKKLFEALARISSVDGAAPPHGAEEGAEEKAKMQLLLMLMREIVRVGELIKMQDVLNIKTQGWLEAPADTIDSEAVVRAAKDEFDLSRVALDILDKLKAVGGEAQSLPEAVLEAAQWMEGASDMLKESDFAEARRRQDIAMEFLENAWSVMAMSMSTLVKQDREQEGEADNKPGESEMREAHATGVGVNAVTDDGKPWYWDLPPQAREAVQQSMDEAFPPKYAPAIERYYQRLSTLNDEGR